jgi:cold shock CspA family protein
VVDRRFLAEHRVGNRNGRHVVKHGSYILASISRFTVGPAERRQKQIEPEVIAPHERQIISTLENYNVRTYGRLRNFIEDKYLGFFIGDDGETYFAHGNELQKSGINVLPPAGSRFSFDVEQNSKGFRALNIEVEA